MNDYHIIKLYVLINIPSTNQIDYINYTAKKSSLMGCCKTKIKNSEGPKDNDLNHQPDEVSIQSQLNSQKVILRPQLSKPIVSLEKSNREREWLEANKQMTGQKMLVKIPKDETRTQFEQIYEIIYQLPPKIADFQGTNISHHPFQVKLLWFREKLQKSRIPWDQSHATLEIDRQNIIFSGLEVIQKVDLHQQLKIHFKQEKVDDAGGPLREWMHLCISEIFSPDLGLFQLCDTPQGQYKLSNKIHKSFMKDLIEKPLTLLGLIIGKALFERIPLGCFLNKTLIRLLCGQRIQIQDTFSLDKELYNSWISMLNDEDIEEMNLTYSIMKCLKGKHYEQIELIPNGRQIPITQENKEQYLRDVIHYYCYDSISESVEVLKRALYSIIPRKYLKIFQPEEFDLILNGPQTIDIEQWQTHTQYSGYEQTDYVIIEFWQIMKKFSFGQLRNFLHFCTGVTRVPVHGFAFLESNRSQIKKFKIVKIHYQGEYMYPKAYTCFNRLQLPNYPTKEALEQKLVDIANIQNNFFGLS